MPIVYPQYQFSEKNGIATFTCLDTGVKHYFALASIVEVIASKYDVVTIEVIVDLQKHRFQACLSSDDLDALFAAWSDACKSKVNT